MEFWGIEVKPGKPVTVQGEDDYLVHVSQASLGDCGGKKGESVCVYVKVGTQKLVLGSLHSENIPQLSCDLVFEKEFELSHNGKGSVYFTGYKSPNIEAEDGDEFSDSEEEEEEVEEVPATVTAKGTAVAKPNAKAAKPADDDEEDDSDSEGMDEDDSDGDEEDSEEEEDTPTPKKPVSGKKRGNEAAPKSPVSAKKAKAEEKKKGGPATPHPAKKGGKTPTAATQSPKSASQVSCGSCKKTFNSGNALESHNKAKHAAAK